MIKLIFSKKLFSEQTDTFTFECRSLDELHRIILGHKERPEYPLKTYEGREAMWHVAHVTVTDPSAGVKFEFLVRKWIDINNEGDVFECAEKKEHIIAQQCHRHTIKYKIIVHTGDVAHAGTDANVSIIIYGTLGDTGIRKLKQKGELTKLHIEHDNDMISPDWFLDKVEVINIDTNETISFPCNRWLGSSFNQPKFRPTATWNANGITFANQSIVGQYPSAIFVSTNNTIYVTNPENNTIIIWQEESVNPTKIISSDFKQPLSLFVTSNGDIYIDDGFENDRVQRWNAEISTFATVMNINSSCAGLFVDIHDTLYCSMHYQHQVLKTSLNDPMMDSNVVAAGTGIRGSASNQLYGPHGIFVDVNLDLYVADSYNDRVQLFQSGELQGITIAGSGSLIPTITLYYPTGVILDADKYLFIVDSGNHRIVGSGANGFRCLVGCHEMDSQPNQLSGPSSLSFDSYGNIFVSDQRNSRIQKFLLMKDSFDLSFNQPKFCPTATWNSNGITVANQSIVGRHPNAFFVNTNNTIYVVNQEKNTIVVWEEDSNNPTKIISGGFMQPLSLFETTNGDIYIDDGDYNRRVQKWSAATGTFVTVMNINSSCAGLFVDIHDTLYCSMPDHHQVVKRSLIGSAMNSNVVAAGTGIYGSASNLLGSPRGIFVDVNLDLYVADCGNNRVQLFQSGESNGITIAGSTTLYPTITLRCPSGITLDAEKYLFIVDSGNHRIVSSGMNGFRCLAGCYGMGSQSSQLTSPSSLSFDRSGNIFVTDQTNHRIQKFQYLEESCDMSSVVETMYTSVLTSNHPIYPRTGCDISYYYEAIKIQVYKSGHYSFNSMSNINTYGYIYAKYFDPFSPSAYLIAEDDDSSSNSQFSISIPLEINTEYILVVTTYNLIETGAFSIRVSGPNRVGLERLNSPPVIQSTYLSMLTENSQHFPQPFETGKHYYESIQINVNMSGLFIISSKSRSDLFGYIYKNSFNPLNPTENLLEVDDNGCSDNQFKLLIALEVNTKYILVVTTSQANVTGTFSIILSGPTKAVLERTTLSVNQPKFCPTATWNSNGITLANQSIVGQYPHAFFVDINNTAYVANQDKNIIVIWQEGSVNPTKIITGNFAMPYSLFVTSNGDIYIDDGNHNGRVQRWNAATSTFVTVMNVNSLCAGLFVDIHDTLYCSIYFDHQVVKRSLHDSAMTSNRVAAGIGIAGSDSNQLAGPRGIFVDVNLDLYVADCENNRVQLFQSGESNGITVAGSGSLNPTITLSYPAGVILDADKYLFIVDSGYSRIVGSSLNGFRCLAGCYGQGSESSQLSAPSSFSFDHSGNMFVTDQYNHRIQKFQYLEESCGDSSLIETMYSLSLTSNSATYFQDCSELDSYYEAIQMNISMTGHYTFLIKSEMKTTHAYIYVNNFNPFDMSKNLLSLSGDSGNQGQFQLSVVLEANMIYVVVITTSSPNLMGSFSIQGSGSSYIGFNRILNTPSVVQTSYASELTTNSSTYLLSCSSSSSSYEAIQVKVSRSGLYTFFSKSNLDTYGSIYKDYFNPSNPTKNRLNYDDNSCNQRQFGFTIALETSITYILVVTTNDYSKIGAFSIFVSGPNNVDLKNISSPSVIQIPYLSTRQSNYSSELTTNSQKYSRDGQKSNYYYQAIPMHVMVTGHYALSSSSNMDTFGYIYKDDFNSMNPFENLLSQDYRSCSYQDFKFITYLQTGTKYILVVTTSSPNITGKFSILTSGPNDIILNPYDISSTSTSTFTTAFTTTTKPSYACMNYHPTWILIMICSIINLMKKLI
ncbi:unnamed protein product [Adineta steineri]|uniref:PLAT domain-containing protein n=1 Tax=Adineta steineri TaxID=433720 RepID=A0A813TZI5_9BILA|nr:unnamed protein product [Adineta steineri]